MRVRSIESIETKVSLQIGIRYLGGIVLLKHYIIGTKKPLQVISDIYMGSHHPTMPGTVDDHSLTPSTIEDMSLAMGFRSNVHPKQQSVASIP